MKSGIGALMKEIQYMLGDAAAPKAAGNKIIAHICNEIGA
jgi:hypothetical protein